MKRADQGGAAQVMAAVTCAVAALIGMPGTAGAADGAPLGAIGGPAAPSDPAAVATTAAAIATEAADGAAPAASAATADPAAGQYQTPDGQYQGESGQYQTPATPPPDTNSAAPSAGAAAANINVSVRVLSPGDDAAVDQSVSATLPAAGGTPAVGVTAPATIPAPSVTISVTVNVTKNWTVVFSPQVPSGQYQPPANQYQDPVSIGAAITAATQGAASAAAPSAAVANTDQPPASPSPVTARDRWAAAARARPLRAGGAPHTSVRRGTPNRPGPSRTAERRDTVVALAAVSSPQPPASWPAVRPVAHRAAPRDGARTRPGPAHAPAPPRPPSVPEQLAGTAAAGGLSFANVLQTLGLLVASLWIAALAPARRLGGHGRRLRGIVGPRPAKPG